MQINIFHSTYFLTITTGVNKVNENSIAATGVIETSVNNLPQTLYSFIEKVPTDADIVFEGKRTI